MQSYSDQIPSQIELISPETYRVRWDIKKETIEIEGSSREQYSYSECTVYAPLTQDSILQSAIRETISQSQELKLINDYNAYQFKLISDTSVVERYRQFIEWRDGLKKKLDEVCFYNHIS